MAFIYELKIDSDGSDAGSYSDWHEDYNGGNSGADPGAFPNSVWNIDLANPATNAGANGSDGGGIVIGSIVQTSDDGGTSSDPSDVGDGNLDAGETFTIQIDDGNGGFDTLSATVDYYFTPNAHADTSVMVFLVDNGDGSFSKYAYNLGNGDPSETDPQKIEGGRVTEGMTNSGHTFSSYEDRVITCFARGTKLETPTGEVLIEDIMIGDYVLTVDNGAQTVRWIGSRKLKSTRTTTPIRIKSGALGEQMPNFDLLVSPAHRVLISGWRAQALFGEPEYLVAAKDLVNDHTIVVAYDMVEVEYFHLLFDKHEIVTSNGTPSESFHPNVDALSALTHDARTELYALFPELTAKENGGYSEVSRPLLSCAEAKLLS
ncbi:MAG: Hint domain-containing protein [Rhodobacteraceae bacterium]|nr:Hint domain-containing protein [Paracoccaceae bacterium]